MKEFLWLRDNFELSRSGAGGSVRPMEGIRGFAVALVFLVHYATLSKPWLETGSLMGSLASALHDIGNAGVDLFFVLSGYLIYRTLISKDQKFLPFILRRLKRIYPAFSNVFLLYILLSFSFPNESKIPDDSGLIYLVKNFILLPGIFQITPMISIAWSLSYEMFYYVLMPFVIMTFRMRTRKCEARILIRGWYSHHDGTLLRSVWWPHTVNYVHRWHTAL